MSFRAVIRTADLWPGEMKAVTLAGHDVLLINLDGEIHAYLDRCPHKRIPLSLGALDKGVLTCGAHQWQFDAACGQGLNPETARLTAVPVRVAGDDVEIDVTGLDGLSGVRG